MTGVTGVERRLADHYADEPALRAPDRLLLGALTTIESTPQRRGLLAPWRFTTMRTYGRLAAAAALIVVLIGVGAIALGPRLGIGGPAPTATPSPAPTPTDVPGPTLFPGTTINLMAQNIDFSPDTLSAPANEAFVVHFRNADPADIQHTVEIRKLDGVTALQQQNTTPGGTAVDYEFDPLPPGDYVFICAVHPIASMTGTLRVR